MIRSLVILSLLAGLAYSARSFLPSGAPGHGSAALAFGFLLLACLQTGRIFHALELPHLTGFLLTGLLFGPEVLGLLGKAELADLALIKRVAVGLIALSAGCELNFKRLRPRLGTVLRVSGLALSLSLVLLWGFLFVAVAFLPLGEGLSAPQRAVVALVGANALVALSPAVVVGIVSETRAQGPLTELALALVVVADLVVLVVFTMTEAVVGTVFEVDGASGAVSLAGHILGSLLLGAILGFVLAIYVQRVGRKVGLFVFGLLFVVAEGGGALHLDSLLVGLAAGLFLENVSDVSGDHVARETEAATLPTFAVFFGVVGAEIHLHDFMTVAPWALCAALVRAAGMSVGGIVGARRSGMPEHLARQVPYGLLPQAGVAIALALLVAQKFGAWGAALSTLLLGTIVVNELVGPILWRMAVVRVGEAGARDLTVVDHTHARRAPTITPLPGGD